MSKEEESIEQQIDDLVAEEEPSKKDEDTKTKETNQPEPEEETFWE